MRLIDADRLKGHFSWWEDDNEYKRIFNEIIDQQETVTVVRCKECKFWHKEACPCGQSDEYEFCSFGEGKGVGC